MNAKEVKVNLKKNIKDLEIELEYIEIRRPHDIKYIRKLENEIDDLYKQLEEQE